MNTKRMLVLAALLGAAAASPRGFAAEQAPVAAPLSATKTTTRAPWQERFTLGPGDELKAALFDANEMKRADLIVGPDGRVTFLEAEGVMATGLTVDELRVKLDAELKTFYQMPRTVVTPVAYRSKKFVVMGAVVNSGIFPMDRPTTVIEAVARAGGLETGVYKRSTVELADLTRSFLVRNGERVPVDFERLFQQGDLKQNASLEPGDYLYIAAASANEVYVLGQVGEPGVVAYATKPTVISAITSRGGFGTKAFKSRVLVVRGSLNNPQTFVVDVAAIMAGKSPDFKLQQKDIVYVSANPWLQAAEVLDTAARAFLQAMTVTATSLNVGPLITTPIIK
jgi:protein involved in polysaccharide export with SLBB domain